MTTWQEDIHGCFGTEDKKFGVHPSDEQHALALGKRMKEEGVSWADAEKVVLAHLDGCKEEHIEEQLKNAKRLLVLLEPHK